MATANSYLRVTELDFEEIRTNLKSYLSTQTQFQDYDFEGSAMAVLLDVLAYNTHYNAYYVNMLANEMFIDTAQLRESIVSHAKLLGYTPISAIGAAANVNISFTGVDTATSQFTIPKYSKLVTTLDDVQYTYVTPQAYTVKNVANTFSIDATIKEGVPLTHRFVVSGSEDQRFVIPNENVDTTSITVNVQESESDTTTTEYTLATDIIDILSTSAVYFLEEAYDGKYELSFGSGSLGKSLKSQNIIIVSYLVTSGSDTNGATVFSVDDFSGITENYTSVTVTLNEKSAGGRPQETAESIKFNAPRNYQTQNRLIIDNDYQRVITAENPDLQSVVAFGGENASPAVYGKVYIAVKPYSEQFVTQTRKLQIRESILNRTPLSIDPVIIDPDYTYIIPTVTTYYNKSLTTVSTSELSQTIKDTIGTFSINNLERFGNRLRYSRFVRALDNIQTGSILNTDASLQLQKRIVPNVNAAEKVILNFNNPITPSTLSTTSFTFRGFNCFIDDNGTGLVRIYRFDQSRQKVIVSENVGTIDYTNGVIEINSFNPTAYTGIEMYFNVTPSRLDIIPIREQILIMSPNDVVVNLVGETY
jgi:hypothetical protein